MVRTCRAPGGLSALRGPWAPLTAVLQQPQDASLQNVASCDPLLVAHARVQAARAQGPEKEAPAGHLPAVSPERSGGTPSPGEQTPLHSPSHGSDQGPARAAGVEQAWRGAQRPQPKRVQAAVDLPAPAV